MRRIPYIFVILLTAAMVVMPDNTIAYARSGLELCGRVIVPSLFPFFVCSGLLIYSGVSESLSKASGGIMKPLFNISGCGSAALVLGLISGYPLGALCACQLYESGYLSRSETERLLAFCNNSGPLFVLGAVGTAIFGSKRLGAVLYLSHILAALLVGIVFRFYARDKHSAPKYRISQPERGFAEVFSGVLANSITSILTVCGAVVFFSVVSGVVTGFLPVSGGISALITGLLELSGGTQAISASGMSLAGELVMAAGIVGFAGLSVHLQVAAIALKYELSLVPYLVGKILHGMISAGLVYLYVRIFPETVSVFSPAADSMSAGFCMGSVYSAANILFVALLAVLTVIFLKMLRKQSTFGAQDR